MQSFLDVSVGLDLWEQRFLVLTESQGLEVFNKQRSRGDAPERSIPLTRILRATRATGAHRGHSPPAALALPRTRVPLLPEILVGKQRIRPKRNRSNPILPHPNSLHHSRHLKGSLL